ncbi:hypothetical protein [Phenylobacterium sp.]|uniref:hypothetical protein n=1 Tax=Phenylobacterium sp. TaxID=1871053 RepID=UPI0037C87672
MNLKRLLGLAAALAAIAVAAGVCVIAMAATLFALVKPGLGEAGAAAVVALVCAALAVLIAVIALRKASPPRPRPGAAPEPASPTERIVALARQHPVLAAGAGVVALVILARNPAIVSAAVTALATGRGPKPRR